MADTGGATTPAGWFTDPGGSGHLRWWDGTAWTAHLAPQPTPEPSQIPHPSPTPVALAPVVLPPVEPTPATALTADNQPYVPFQGSWNTNAQATAYPMGAVNDFARPAQWNTVGVWLLAFSGLLSIGALLISLQSAGASITTLYGSGALVGSSAVAFLVSVIFAEADRRKLRSLGYLRVPSLWWMLLAPPLVYLILRTVAVWGEVRKGIAPLITYFVVNVVGGVGTALAIAVVLPGALGLNSSASFAASLKTGLEQKGGHFSVTCPPTIPKTIGATFNCTAIDASGISHVLSIQVVTGADGKPGVKLLSVTPTING